MFFIRFNSDYEKRGDVAINPEYVTHLTEGHRDKYKTRIHMSSLKDGFLVDGYVIVKHELDEVVKMLEDKEK